MVIVQIVDSKARPTTSKPCGTAVSDGHKMEAVIEEMYNDASVYRPRPCVDSISDRYRFLRYDLAPSKATAEVATRHVPLLIVRHNVRQGMTLLYHGGHLIFCGAIHPPTSNALILQLETSWRLALRSFSLPNDYRINSSVSRRRTGEISIDFLGSAEAALIRQSSEVVLSRFLIKSRPSKSQEAGRENVNGTADISGVTPRNDLHHSSIHPCLHMPTV